MAVCWLVISNVPIATERPIAGDGTTSASGQQQDQTAFQEVLRTHNCCVLNTWTGRGPAARTYIPPQQDGQGLGTQIDFFIVRGHLADDVAKRAAPFDAPYVPATGCRHRPIRTTVLAPRRPRPPQTVGMGRPSILQVRRHLRLPGVQESFLDQVTPALLDMSLTQEIDDELQRGWRCTMDSYGSPRPQSTSELVQRHSQGIKQRIHQLWQLRGCQRSVACAARTVPDGPGLSELWAAWKVAAKLQLLNRQLRKDCRLRKTARIAEAVRSQNVHQAAKQFAPKQCRKRLQLRSESGDLLSHEAELGQITEYFHKLYQGEGATPARLSRDISFSVAEIQEAMARLKAGKAMPSGSAPTVLWTMTRSTVVPILHGQFQAYLRAGCSEMPERWVTSEMVLLPKPGKALTSPAQLRPINLLPMQAKLLGAMIAARLQDFAQVYLRDVPQFAYVTGRSLGQAVERVAAHCAHARKLYQDQHGSLRAKREGHRATKVAGGCLLSLDISKAYDLVRWSDLTCALREAHVPGELIELILLLHQQAKIRISHEGQTRTVGMRQGLKQGCGLAPILWALYCGWVLKDIHDGPVLDIRRCNTSYADDLLFSWLIRTGRDVEKAYAAMKRVLRGLHSRGLRVSTDKTVIMLALQGPGSEQCLRRYLVERPGEEGKFFKFTLETVTQHTYLGVQISYRKFEQATFRHRLSLAQGTFARLSSILKCRAIPVKLRLQLWQGTVLPTLLHGLDSVGLQLPEIQTMLTVFFQQSRSIAKSFSMFTHESNHDFALRLKLPDLLQRLGRAIQRRGWLDDCLSDSLRPTDAQVQWRQFLTAALADAQSASSLGARTDSTPVKCRLQLVQEVVAEEFPCPTCGIAYATQAALKRHQFRSHLSEEEQLSAVTENRRALRQDVMLHAADGMPKCRHCHHPFTTWDAFYYHVNTRSCSELRAFFQVDPAQRWQQLPSESLLDHPELLNLASHCNWRDLAQHAEVRAKHHHCVECNQWAVKPQYVRRHMLQKHKEQLPLIDRCQQMIAASDLSIQNPCQYCGASYQRKSAHLKSCVGIFNGVYLYHRIARGKVLKDLGVTPGSRHGQDGGRPSGGGHSGAGL